MASVHIQCILEPALACYKGVKGEVGDAVPVQLVERQNAFKVNAIGCDPKKFWLQTNEGEMRRLLCHPLACIQMGHTHR